MECEYKRFGCGVVLPRKDIAEHLKTSVQDHLQMTPRRVEEQDVRLHEQEVRLKEEKAECQLMEVRLKDVEERAERAERERTELEERAKLERQRMNEAISHELKQLEDIGQRSRKHNSKSRELNAS